jgi:transmembrane sensor
MDRPRVKLNTQIYEEASAWFVECRGCDLDEADRRQFDQWLRKSPEHLAAYLEVAAIWNEGPALDPTREWEAENLIAESRKNPENLVFLPATSAAQDLEESVARMPASATVAPRSRLYRRRLFAPAAFVTAFVIAGAWAWFAFSASVYNTGIGEQRSIELADGSTVSMNSRSKIRVRYSKTKRAVDLIQGQALFHVAKDRGRPFVVNAHDTHVRAVGTQFDVYEKHEGTTVTVLEGRVAVLQPAAEANVAPSNAGTASPRNIDAAPAATILVSAGEQLTVTPQFARKSEHPNVAAATAWTQRQINFEAATLSEVAEEFNRYNERQLVIEGPDLLSFHISGVFSSTDPESLIRFLREQPGVAVTEEGSEVRVSKKL